jgi:ribosome modulation factor
MDDLAEISTQYYAGMQDRRNGVPFTTEQSEAWQKGWRDCDPDGLKPPGGDGRGGSTAGRW